MAEEKKSVPISGIPYSDVLRERGRALRFTLGKDGRRQWVHAGIGGTRTRRMLLAGDDEGKMNFLQAMISELAGTYSPSELRLVLLDGPFSELSPFRGLPHLISDVVAYGLPQALFAMDWAVAERKRRFSVFNQKLQEGLPAHCFEQYNECCADEALPRILIVAEEICAWGIGDRRAECALSERIADLATYGHAAGIHMIFGTRRTSSQVADIFRSCAHTDFAAFSMDEQGAIFPRGTEQFGSMEFLYGAWEKYGDPPERIKGIRIWESELRQTVASAKEKFKTPQLYSDVVF